MSEEALRDLDAEIAIKLFGWRWFRRPPSGPGKWRGDSLVGIAPPEMDGWVRWNWVNGTTLHEEIPEGCERYVDWDRGCSQEDSNGRQIQRGLPHYSTDIAAAWEVVAKAGEHGFSVSYYPPETWEDEEGITHIENGYYGVLLSLDEDTEVEADDDTMPLAVCKAALKALAVLAMPSGAQAARLREFGR